MALAAVAAMAFAASCQSGAPAPSSAPSPAASPPPTRTESPAAREEAEKLLSLAVDAIDANHLSEAIKDYVAVLAIAEGDAGAAAAALKAEAELTRIGARLSLEPKESWLAKDGTQVQGSTRAIGKDVALQPSVYLYENYGAGKAPVPDASIAFEFVENGGVLTPFAATDAYGMANANVSRLNDPSKGAVIRAYPVFRVRGRAYAFRSVSRDFAYLPPATTVVVASLSESSLGALKDSLTPEFLSPTLKDAGLDVLPKAGSADRDAFMAAFGGSPAALATLNAEARAGYLLLVFVDVYSVSQVEYDGKKYNLFTAYANASARLMRPDGTVLSTFAAAKVRGDAGDAAQAVDACNKAANAAIAESMKAEAGKIKAALAE